MRCTLIGKMDGGNIVVLPESQYVVMKEGLVDDVVEVLGRVYKVTVHGNVDITEAYCAVAGWLHPLTAISMEDVL